jgi:hypothetical protein
VILAGDSQQLQPIGAGAPFRHLAESDSDGDACSRIAGSGTRSGPSVLLGRLRDGDASDRRWRTTPAAAGRGGVVKPCRKAGAGAVAALGAEREASLDKPAENFVFTQTRAEARQTESAGASRLRQERGAVDTARGTADWRRPLSSGATA